MVGFIGNARAVAALQRALVSPSPPHAWLFVGPEGVGKATLARRLAQALNCDVVVPGTDVGAQKQRNDNGALERHRDVAEPLQGFEPCGECARCRRIEAGIHADVQTVTVEAEEDGRLHKGISVDQVREIERSLVLNPFEGRMRVVIVDPADALSEEAQNAFLKTLEEPPPQAVLVLVATREVLLLPTVRSRCRRLELGLARATEIEEALLGGSGAAEPTTASSAALLARLAGGRAGWALEAARDPAALERRAALLAEAGSLGTLSLSDRFDLAERLAERFRADRAEVFARLAGWEGWWRDVLLVQCGAAAAAVNQDMTAELEAAAAGRPGEATYAFLTALRSCREQLEANVQARIALDALLIEAP